MPKKKTRKGVEEKQKEKEKKRVEKIGREEWWLQRMGEKKEFA